MLCKLALIPPINWIATSFSGSTFPKAKPKQSLLTVLRLALLRFLFLPLYAKWWVAQTSPAMFAALLTLHVLQLLSWAVFSYNASRHVPAEPGTCAPDGADTGDDTSSEHFVSVAELLVPISLSLALSLIHSQIVATASNLAGSSKRRKRITDVMKASRKKCERRLRKKSCRTRSSLNFPVESKAAAFALPKSCLSSSNKINRSDEALLTEHSVTSTSVDQTPPPIAKELIRAVSGDDTTRKRNVIWDSPIKSHVNVEPSAGLNCNEADSGRDADEEGRDASPMNPRPHLDDDGFESLNGKSSSGEEMTTGQREAAEGFDREGSASSSTLNATPSPNVALRPSLSLPAKKHSKVDSSDTDEDRDDLESKSSPTLSSPTAGGSSTTEWIGITTNSEDCSYSSTDNSDSQMENSENGFENFTPTVILNSGCGLSDKSEWLSLSQWNQDALSSFSCSKLHSVGRQGG